jgi:hypothetical protein
MKKTRSKKTRDTVPLTRKPKVHKFLICARPLNVNPQIFYHRTVRMKHLFGIYNRIPEIHKLEFYDLNYMAYLVFWQKNQELLNFYILHAN